MHRIFGRAKPAAPAGPAAPSLDDHIASLGARVPELDRRIAECDAQLLALKAQMGKCRTPQQQAPLRQRAMLLLKRKNHMVQQRDGAQARQFNMEQTQWAIDGMKEAKAHVEVMRTGVASMREAAKDFDIDDVADLHEDMTDMMADVDEINEVLTRSYDTYETVNEADLDSALDALGDDIGVGDSMAMGAPGSAMADPALPPLPSATSVPAAMDYSAPSAMYASYPTVPSGTVDAGAAAAAPARVAAPGAAARF